MSEHEPSHLEQLSSPEESAEIIEKQPENSQETNTPPQESIEEIQQDVKEQASPSDELRVDSEANTTQPTMVDRGMKQQSYRATLGKIQSHLSKPQRVFSKVVHQPIIEAASDISSKTVARPSGILGGGLVSLIGSSIVVYVSMKYGFSYNYFVFILLYVAGFIVGMIVELGLYSLRKARRSR